MNRRAFLLSSGTVLVTSGALRMLPDVVHASELNRASGITGSNKYEGIMHIPFYFVDVFAERPLSGNPLAVVPDAQSLDDATMQQIAAELNQAETTFIFPPRSKSADWRLRSLTAPGHEIFGVGHNSLGAWWWLAESGRLKLSDGSNHFTQEIGHDLLPVDVRYKDGQVVSVVLTQSPPEFARVCEDFFGLAEALGLREADISRSLPAQVVSTGAGHLLVPVHTRSAIERAHPDSQRLAKVLKAVGGEGCYIYCLEPVSMSSVAHARFFNPTMGIVEDSATGTAAGPLACQLVKHGIAKDGSTMRIEQGYEMKRPSILTVEVHGNVVRLAGRGVRVIEGTLRV